MEKNMTNEIIEVLTEIKHAIQRNYIGSSIEQPGIVEGGFMRIHDNQQETNNQLGRIADALEGIFEQLEIINSPAEDLEFNKWYYEREKRLGTAKSLLNIYTENNNQERIDYYKKIYRRY